jgi:hypothetical protein
LYLRICSGTGHAHNKRNFWRDEIVIIGYGNRSVVFSWTGTYISLHIKHFYVDLHTCISNKNFGLAKIGQRGIQQ